MYTIGAFGSILACCHLIFAEFNQDPDWIWPEPPSETHFQLSYRHCKQHDVTSLQSPLEDRQNSGPCLGSFLPANQCQNTSDVMSQSGQDLDVRLPCYLAIYNAFRTATMAGRLEELGVLISFSKPRASNDNPYSEPQNTGLIICASRSPTRIKPANGLWHL
jgi:hypothetical protein